VRTNSIIANANTTASPIIEQKPRMLFRVAASLLIAGVLGAAALVGLPDRTNTVAFDQPALDTIAVSFDNWLASADPFSADDFDEEIETLRADLNTFGSDDSDAFELTTEELSL